MTEDDQLPDRRDRPAKVSEALLFQKLSAEAFSDQRQREIADLEFQVPEKQWPEAVRLARQGQTVNGIPIPARPMLSIPKLDQPIQITFNQWTKAHFGVGIHPVSSDADDDTAKVIQGLYRAIEVDSRANLARGWGFDRAIKAGMGAYRVNTVYDDSTDDPFDLKVVIQRILRQSAVYWDPFAVEPDFSDATRCLIVEYMGWEAYKSAYPKSTLGGYDSDQLSELGQETPFWVTGDHSNRAVAVAEYFYADYDEMIVTRQKDGQSKTEPIIDRNTVILDAKTQRIVKQPVIRWCKINAIEILEEGVWNGRYIPIIPCIGKELQPFDKERRWVGMIGPNKDSARLFNYEVTNAVETDALSPKAPFIGAVGQFRTNNAQWQLANQRNFPYLEYDPVTVQGNLAGPPQRNLASPDLSSSIALIQIANQNIQAGTSLFDESLGKNTAQKSGKAVLAIQQQGDLSQSHYLSNMADITMTYEAKVVLDLIPRIYDRAGRVARILGENQDRREVILNQPFTVDPQTKRPVPAPTSAPSLRQRMGAMIGGTPAPTGPSAKPLHYDLTKGKYGVVVSVGKAYQTRAQEGSDALGTMIQAEPQLMIPLGPTWAKFQDWPGHEEVAEILKKLQPAQLQDQENPDDPQALKTKLAQAEQAIQVLGQKLQQASTAIQAKQVEQQGKLAIVQVQEQAETDRAAADRETKIAVAELGAKVDRLALFLEERARVGLAAHDAAHDAAMADVQQQHDVAMAEQAHQQALTQADAQTQNTMATQANQAALQPTPTPGGANA